jgi:hypothetical protein
LVLHPHKGMLAGGHYIYRIDLRYEHRRLELPKWVSEWSCDNDADQSQIRRTMNLKHILNAVMLNSNEDIPVFSGFLSVYGW